MEFSAVLLLLLLLLLHCCQFFFLLPLGVIFAQWCKVSIVLDFYHFLDNLAYCGMMNIHVFRDDFEASSNFVHLCDTSSEVLRKLLDCS